MTQHTVLSTQNLTVGYTPARRPVRAVVSDINAALYQGELVCLIGPNGAGKSTLMRTLAGMQAPLAGHVSLLGDDITLLEAGERARRLSIVLTERVEAGGMTAYALVALGRHPHTDWTGNLSTHDHQVIAWALDAVGAAQFGEHIVDELSDGERQKVMIARALAQEPALMLLDEPTAYLDLPRRVEIMRTLRELAQSTGRAILLSTHDLDLALRSADRIWLLSNAGLQIGAPEDLVLNGAFEAAFQSEGVEFDPYSGAFRLHQGTLAQVMLVGTDVLTMTWTTRALERAGFTPTTTPQTLKVEVLASDHWRLTTSAVSEDCNSLYQLVNALRATLR